MIHTNTIDKQQHRRYSQSCLDFIRVLETFVRLTYTSIDTFMFFFVCISVEEETGMDISRHNGPAYEMDIGSAKAEDIAALNRSRHGNSNIL